VGRAARQQRRGVAFNLIVPDELGYMVDLHLYLGRQPSSGGEEGSRASYGVEDMTPEEMHFGSMPRSVLDDGVENLRVFTKNIPELVVLQKSCNNALKLYYKTRAEPSGRSIQRGKELAGN
jgi:ATP-dependent RNA helicase DDX54/DBP10